MTVSASGDWTGRLYADDRLRAGRELLRAGGGAECCGLLLISSG
jgi:hypothetical protein